MQSIASEQAQCPTCLVNEPVSDLRRDPTPFALAPSYVPPSLEDLENRAVDFPGLEPHARCRSVVRAWQPPVLTPIGSWPLGADPSTPAGRLVANVRAMLAEWDRDMAVPRAGRAPADDAVERYVEQVRADLRAYDAATGRTPWPPPDDGEQSP